MLTFTLMQSFRKFFSQLQLRKFLLKYYINSKIKRNRKANQKNSSEELQVFTEWHCESGPEFEELTITSKLLLIHSCPQNHKSPRSGVSSSVPAISKVPSLHRENRPNPPKCSSEVNLKATKVTFSFQLSFPVSKGARASGNTENASPGQKRRRPCATAFPATRCEGRE